MLKSPRLIFKKIKEHDRPLYIAQVKIDNVMRYITGKGLSDEQANKRFDEAIALGKKHRDYGIFTVWLKNTENTEGGYIGLARLKLDEYDCVEIGYNLLENYWGKGYGLEIGAALMSFLKKHPEREDIYAIVEPENIGSVKILEKLSLRRTKEMADATAVYYRFIKQQ
jgi:[ribosomal protein S5]-alanine N-acetyltransferase